MRSARLVSKEPARTPTSAAATPPTAPSGRDELTPDVKGNQDLVTTLVRLALATGQLGQEGVGIGRLVEDNNSWGALDMGITPGTGPGYSQAATGLSYSEMLGANGQTPLKALLVMGALPAIALAGSLFVIAVNADASACNATAEKGRRSSR